MTKKRSIEYYGILEILGIPREEENQGEGEEEEEKIYQDRYIFEADSYGPGSFCWINGLPLLSFKRVKGSSDDKVTKNN